ncbi:MAG: VacJ family lipoprotein [Campylobacterota bacterium]|nr:VacJ family lipoprotein [Campylobacterota bacterium]
MKNINFSIIISIIFIFNSLSFAQELNDDFMDEFSEEMTIEESSDPLKGYNKVATSFNHGAMTHVVIPMAKGYEKATPDFFRDGVNNFFRNILFPIRFANNMLQLKFKNSFEETQRFLINSTIGIAGLRDVAHTHFKIHEHKEDFGQTLGHYGVGSGPHIVVPFYGPSNLRDLISMYPDSLVDPVVYNQKRSYNLTAKNSDSTYLKTYDKFNYASLHYNEYEEFTKDAVDLYTLFKTAYEQNRDKLIKE